MTEGMAEMKPCPFCGKKGTIGKQKINKMVLDYWVECNNDDCRVCSETDMCSTEKEAIEIWNKREGEDG